MRFDSGVRGWSRSLLAVLIVGAASAAGLAVGCSSSSKAPPTIQCILASDCKDMTKQCVQGYCVGVCTTSQDCPSGQRCVKYGETTGAAGAAGDTGAGGAGGMSAAVVAVSAGNICQVPEVKTCALNSDCTPGLFCAKDLQCRNMCNGDVDCLGGVNSQNPPKCTMSHYCVDPVADANIYDPTTNDFKPNVGAGGMSGGTGGNVGGGGKGGAGGKPASACATPQTAFGNLAQGDSNLSFTSGVAARVAGRLLIFSAYVGPPVALGAGGGSGDAGGAGGGAPTANYVYVQTFDPVSGVATGPATPLFKAADGPNFGLWGATAVSSGGEVAVLTGTAPSGANNNSLNVSFISSAGGTVQFEKTVLLESAEYGNVTAFWSEANSEFVFAWKNNTNGWQVRTKKFQPGGTPAGGDSNSVNFGSGIDDANWTFGVGASGHLFGVAARAAGNLPTLALLDADGTAAGAPFPVDSSATGQWINVGGTTKGFVVSWQRSNTAYFTFIPKLADDTGVVPQSAGGAGGGDGAGGASGWTAFSIGSTATGPNVTYTSSDELGAGGVGTVYRETNGASFIYVTADGAKHYAVGTPLSSTSGTTVSITNYAGSFSLGLFETAKHATMAAASGCSP